MFSFNSKLSTILIFWHAKYGYILWKLCLYRNENKSSQKVTQSVSDDDDNSSSVSDIDDVQEPVLLQCHKSVPLKIISKAQDVTNNTPKMENYFSLKDAELTVPQSIKQNKSVRNDSIIKYSDRGSQIHHKDIFKSEKFVPTDLDILKKSPNERKKAVMSRLRMMI